MAIFGNVIVGTNSLGLPDVDEFGHFDKDEIVNVWNANIPTCTITKMWVYARGSSGSDPKTLRMAVYDASDPIPENNWTVEAESPVFAIISDNVSRWYSVDCNFTLTAGKKALAILAYDGADQTSIYYTDKVSGLASLSWITAAGVFEDPLYYLHAPITNNWSMYAEYTEISPTIDTTTITSDARIVDPLHFEYAEPSDATSKSRRNYDTFDIKLKHACNHYLSNIQYTLSKCPRCLGTGYYYDAKFNEMGRLIQISLEDKLQQALEKLVLTDENKFHTDVAIGLKKWLGEVPISKIKAVIKYDLVKSLAVLQETQRGVLNLSGQARIASVDNIEVYENSESPDTLEYLIEITTMAGDTKELTGTVIVGE